MWKPKTLCFSKSLAGLPVVLCVMRAGVVETGRILSMSITILS